MKMATPNVERISKPQFAVRAQTHQLQSSFVGQAICVNWPVRSIVRIQISHQILDSAKRLQTALAGFFHRRNGGGVGH